MLLIGLGVVVGAMLAALELRRAAPRAPLRALLAFVTAAALGGLAGQPTRRTTIGSSLIVQTTRTSSADLRAARDSLPGASLLELGDSLTVTDLLARSQGAPIAFVGDGPAPAWWPALDGHAVRVIQPSAPVPDGFALLRAATSVRLGEPWTIRGRLALASRTAPTMLRASGPDGRVDSVPIASDARGRFELAVRPRSAGHWQWILDAGGEQDTLGVTVLPRVPRTVLLIASTPSFELTALKRRLADQGERVLMRVKSSKAKVVTEYVNLPTGPAQVRLDDARLRDADALVMLGSPVDAFDDAERRALTRALQNGLGVIRIIRSARDLGDAADPALVPGRTRATEAAQELDGLATRIRGRERSAPVPAAELRFDVSAGTEVLLRDPSDRALAVVRPIGEGRLAGTLVADAARWRTLGDTLAFDGYWRTLFDAVRAPARTSPWDAEGEARHVVGARVTLSRLVADTVLTAGAAVRLVRPDGGADTLPIVRGGDDPARRVTAFMPRVSGWHALHDDSDSSVTHLLVAAAPSPAFDATARRMAAAEAMRTSRHATVGADVRRDVRVALLPPSVWLLLAVISASLLWLLQRRDG